jgi:4-amino-4-deoxy-L-arabinose transferase-like glycosyltransferase
MSTIIIPSEITPEPKKWLEARVFWCITPALILLTLILLLSLGLHLYNIQSIGDGNVYYTAAVKSMLQSWHNFFFVAAEPGGSVTVDKPPLGFWIETAFAAVLGVSGFSVTLPNIMAGVLSILVLYHLVQKFFGVVPGLVAALVLALTPVSLAVDRNNTIDGMLILVLLLAAWAFIKAVETGRLRSLLLGAVLVGLGFNIKMLQAFLPLPAFYALYFFGAKTGWRRKLFNLGLASLVLIVISLAWAVAVDLTPASERPYVGSTSTNSEMELIFGYNGINRLLGMMGRGRIFVRNVFDDPSNTNPNLTPPNRLENGNPPLYGQPGYIPPNYTMGNNPPNNPGNGNLPPNGQPGQFPGQDGNNPRNNAGGPGMLAETGQPGVLRFFQAPLAKEMSWLLPFALLAVIPAAFSRRIKLPTISNEQRGLILWGGWLLTCLVFFSIAGFFHNYYLATLSPALGALVGIGFSGFEKLNERSHLWSGLGLLAVAAATLFFQFCLVTQLGLNGAWRWIAGALLGVAGVAWLVSILWKERQILFSRLFTILAILSILIIPALWSVRTVTSGDNATLPAAYTGDNSNRGFGSNFLGNAPGLEGGGISSQMLAYLQANTQDIEYLLAVGSSHTGSSLVLETGRPVLLMGGFSGSDPVVDADSLAKLVDEGRLRYILYGGNQGFGGGSADISAWLQSSCQGVSDFSSGQNPGGRGNAGLTLYECGL